MKEILQRLEGSPGINGALVMTLDGIVVASLKDEAQAERISAFVSAALLSMEREAEELDLAPFKRLTLWAAEGRVIVVPLEELALVVIADRVTDLGYTLMEIAGLAQGVLRRSKIDVEV
jgi:predicted regulator of Ras-like GTPase activity (Roadblock/LC7/MglB family)